MITIQIADDDILMNLSLMKFLAKEKDIKIIDITSDGQETINSYYQNLPDILILDLDLPIKNGLQVLEELALNYNELRKCNIIIYSGAIHNLTPRNLVKVFHMCQKPCTFDIILDKVRDIHRNLVIDNYQKECMELFYSLGFNTSSFGANYLLDAIILLKQENSYIFNMEDIYRKLGNLKKIPHRKIKWNIEKSIDSMYRFTSVHTIKGIFSDYDITRKITPKYLISLTLSKL